MSRTTRSQTQTKKSKKGDAYALLDELIAQAVRIKFKPVAYYKEIGDVIEAVWQDCSYYSVWLNDEVTVFKKSHDDKRGKRGDIVGVQIWALNDDDGTSRRIKDVIGKKHEKTS